MLPQRRQELHRHVCICRRCCLDLGRDVGLHVTPSRDEEWQHSYSGSARRHCLLDRGGDARRAEIQVGEADRFPSEVRGQTLTQSFDGLTPGGSTTPMGHQEEEVRFRAWRGLVDHGSECTLQRCR